MHRRGAWWGFAAGAVMTAAAWLLYVPATPPGHLDPDLTVYRKTIALMRGGEGYYPAMHAALVAVIGPPDSIRAFRPPTMFWIWAAAPWLYTWPVVLAMVLLSTWLVARLSHPFAGLAIGLWLLIAVRPVGIQQWGYVELWTLPLVLAAMWAFRTRHVAAACVLAFAAALTREFAVAVLVGGALAAWRFRRPIWPWIAAIGAWCAFMAWHVTDARRWLVPHGIEAPLIGTGGWSGILNNTGCLLGPIGAIVVLAALWRSRGTPEWWLVAPILAGMTLLGVVASRPYWSFLVLPVAVSLMGAPVRESTRSTVVILPEADDRQLRPLDSEQWEPSSPSAP